MDKSDNDALRIVAKGVLGALPFVGPLASEIIGSIIPNQRIDRIEEFLKILENKIDHDTHLRIQRNITLPESIDLIEDSFMQASRALTKDRKSYIASLLKNSLTDENLEYIEYKRLFSILGELNDLEILILKSKTLRPNNPEYHHFWNTHQSALTPPSATINSSQQEFDQNTIFQTHNRHLINLGLLQPVFKKPRKGEFPDFDEKTGMIKAQRHEITSLGRLLLNSVDI